MEQEQTKVIDDLKALNNKRNEVLFNMPFDNFFIKQIAPVEYVEAKKALKEASKPPRKKVYRSMTKMLQECYFVGSLKYGNNFIM